MGAYQIQIPNDLHEWGAITQLLTAILAYCGTPSLVTWSAELGGYCALRSTPRTWGGLSGAGDLQARQWETGMRTVTALLMIANRTSGQ